MCTVTIIPVADGIRLACNRDEQHSRPAALPPRIARFGKHRAVFPLDPQGGGTWIAANDAGLVFALLNLNGSSHDEHRLPARRMSRGRVISGLLHFGSLESVIVLVRRLPVEDYAPFRLVIADAFEAVEVRSTGHALVVLPPQGLTMPLLFTSSGLGDYLVEGPRRRLFQNFSGESEKWLEQQDAYHRHRWPACPHLSVCMERADARTVSHTVVELSKDAVAMTYWPDSPDCSTEPFSSTLDLISMVQA
jgi:hypothetical protein